MHGAPVDPHVLRDDTHRASSRSQRPHDDLAHPHGRARRLAAVIGLEHLLRVTRHAGIGVRIRDVEIAPRDDDAVEVVAELDGAAEHARVHGAVGRRIVREAHA